MKENEKHLLWGSRWTYSWWKPSIDKNLHKLNFPCSFLVIENQRTHTIWSDMLRKVFSPFKAYCPSVQSVLNKVQTVQTYISNSSYARGKSIIASCSTSTSNWKKKYLNIYVSSVTNQQSNEANMTNNLLNCGKKCMI